MDTRSLTVFLLTSHTETSRTPAAVQMPVCHFLCAGAEALNGFACHSTQQCNEFWELHTHTDSCVFVRTLAARLSPRMFPVMLSKAGGGPHSGEMAGCAKYNSNIFKESLNIFFHFTWTEIDICSAETWCEGGAWKRAVTQRLLVIWKLSAFRYTNQYNTVATDWWRYSQRLFHRCRWRFREWTVQRRASDSMRPPNTTQQLENSSNDPPTRLFSSLW